MSDSFPTSPLGSVAWRVERPTIPTPGATYRQIGVRLWGAGAYEREPLGGGATQYATLSRVEEGDIVVNKIWARNGSVAVVPSALTGCYGSGEFPTFAPDRSRLDPRWFHWLTKTKRFWSQCDEKSRGTSGKNRIRPERFLEIEIPLPPLDEQRRIVARIEQLAAKIEDARELREQGSAQSRWLLAAMAHREDLGEDQKRSDGWTHTALSEAITQKQDACRVDAQATYPNLGIYSFARGPFPKPPIDGTLTSADTLYRVRTGQFIYSRLFAFEGAYGIVGGEYDGCFVSNEYPTFDCDPQRVLPEFLDAYFKSPTVWRIVASGSKGLGDRRQRVQPLRVLAHQLWIPPIAWQHRIRDAYRSLMTLAPFQNGVAAELDALLPSILDKAFKGEL